MKPCMEYMELMNAVLDGEASPAQESALSAHLEQCPACAALYEDLSALRAGSDVLLTKAPEGLKANVMSTIAAESKPTNLVAFPTKTKKKSASRWRSWAVMAAVFALVIGVGTTQDLFGGSSSAPLPAPSAAPAAQQPQEAVQDTGNTYLTADTEAQGESAAHEAMQAYSSAKQTLENQTEDTPADAERRLAEPAEAAPTPETSDIRLALDMVIHRVYGESGYTLETSYAEEDLSCHVRLLDGETLIEEGTVTHTGLSPNEMFYCFSWLWTGQTEEDARLYRYAVPMDLSYVMWAGDTPDMENYRSALED